MTFQLFIFFMLPITFFSFFAFMEAIEIEGIGIINLVPSNRARRMALRVKPFEGVRVSIPPGTPKRDIAHFIQQNIQWIKEAQKKIQAKENELTIFDEHTQFKSRSFALRVIPDQRHDVRIQLKQGWLYVSYPKHIDVKTPTIQDAIRHGIEEALRREAKMFLPGRLTYLAREFNFKFKNVFIKNLKSRWGSCSGVDNINLNLHLMRLPDHLIDYVLLHELCHTKEKNHGPGFWRLMAHVTNGKAKMMENEMKNYRTIIY